MRREDERTRGREDERTRGREDERTRGDERRREERRRGEEERRGGGVCKTDWHECDLFVPPPNRCTTPPVAQFNPLAPFRAA